MFLISLHSCDRHCAKEVVRVAEASSTDNDCPQYHANFLQHATRTRALNDFIHDSHDPCGLRRNFEKSAVFLSPSFSLQKTLSLFE